MHPPKFISAGLCDRGILGDFVATFEAKCLTNTIYEDPTMAPWAEKVFNRPTREIGGDWPRQAHSMVGTVRLNNLRSLMQACLDEGVPGDFIETGVWRGGCCILMRGVLAANSDTSRRVFVADSFKGLPEPKPDLYPADRLDKHYSFEELSVSLDDVKENFRKYGLLDDQVAFIEGYFEHTLPALDAGPFALIRLDGDMYESTHLALNYLYPKLSRGGYVIIDDYGAVEGCRLAVDDYRSQHSISSPLTKVDWTGAWWKKE